MHNPAWHFSAGCLVPGRVGPNAHKVLRSRMPSETKKRGVGRTGSPREFYLVTEVCHRTRPPAHARVGLRLLVGPCPSQDVFKAPVALVARILEEAAP